MTAATLQSPPADASTTRARAHHAQLVHQTQKWVAQSFYGTLFRQMRQDPFKSTLFDGGRGGEMFNELLDQHLSERMASGAPNKLVNAIVQKIEHGSAAAAGNKATAAGNKAAAAASYMRQSEPLSPAAISAGTRLDIQSSGQSPSYGGPNVSPMD